ncbi:restriction endonuclease subunit S [Sporosarcina aquimarina]|uniref:restriction endonuclease subunit S n=1 Tax=Sporosarcina aquimarina TaxID=114975 RepID=UPI0020411B82|nr:restriction endonuclease subunit S [Sporosarcina aquimarina]MCM3758723.1 restriction endonuclease subunit S [Sporosarcina aquimarina]
MGNKQMPDIRFPGFTDSWEQRKLGGIAEIKDSARIPNTKWQSEGVPYLRSSDLSSGHVNGELFLCIEDYERYASKTGAPEEGDLLFASGGDIGLAIYKDNDSPVYVQGGSILYVKTSKSENLSGLFLQYAFESPKVKSYIKGASTGTSLKHLVLKPANALPISFPTLSEQREIGTFFKQLDETITLHQRKLELLKDTKKSLLQKMFPKDGANVPEIRFPGFTDAWEQGKLGSSVMFINGRAYKQKELLDKGKYRVLRVGNFNTNDSWYYSDLELEDNKYANTGDLLYLWATSFGPAIWNQERVIYHYHIWKLKIQDENIDKQYLYTWLVTDKERIKQTTNGTTMVHVTKGSIEERGFQFPVDVVEQRKIGEFFKQLDHLITLHQRELDALKETKKAFLQKMFV